MRLVRREHRSNISLRNIEAPFFAVPKIRSELAYQRHGIAGIDELARGNGNSVELMLAAVERGDWLLVMDDPFSPLSDESVGKYSHITGRGWKASIPIAQVQQPANPIQTVGPVAKAQPQEPGFYVVPQSTTADKLEAQLFTSPSPAVLDKFKTLNPNLGQVKAGQMIILSDPNNMQCTLEEALLMEAAAKVNAALEPLTPEEANFMARHHDEIESFLTHGATSVGVGHAVFGQHLKGVSTSLSSIEALHQRTFQQHGHLRSPEFFAERKRLFSQLDIQLNSLTKRGIGFPDHPNLKTALGISSRSLVHRWTKAGAPDQIPGYATHIDGVASAAKYVKLGGWIGTAVGGGASYMKVQDVCAAGNTEACAKVKYTETGSFAGGVAGGAAAGVLLSGTAAGAICAALGVPTGGLGTLACGLVVVGAGSLAAGSVGGTIGEKAGDAIYKAGR
ncbi:hypothetical protein [Pseudomonas sp. 1928-m]|uniref:hypothetical protein n=1 Tax=Pseudomonas sp. 1928-m TaxID=3033804 RepID=UPI0023DF3702|nr:hypothetical protein [Pseudomonas sp. 1928-m]MDF3195261.1 hypothetical protein [Pseudomonas sp. 1928-m]